MYSIIDVAKKAGVSKSTVSRVITNNGFVKEETRQAVEEAMKELNYTPSYFAQGIRTGKTKMIAFIHPDSTNVFYNEMLVGVEEVALENGYMVLICNTNRNPESEINYVRELQKRNIDGIIFSTYQVNEDNLKYFRRLSKTLPMVFMDNIYTHQEDVSVVISEGYESSRQIVHFLYEKGSRRIAYIRMQDVGVVNHRYEGYLKGLEDCGIHFKDDLVHVAAYKEINKSHIKMGMDGAQKLLEQPERPDAIMASIDTMAIGAMRYILDQGLRVPEDIRIVGYDNIELSTLIRPRLSTIAQPIKKLGIEAAKLLMHKVQKDNNFNERITFDPIFLEREST